MSFKNFSLTENKAFLLIWVIVTAILYQYFMLKYFSWTGDAAGFVDMLDNTSNGKGMVSSAFSAIYSLMPYLTYTIDQYMNADYKSLYYMQDFSEWHPYMITYLLVVVKSLGFTALQTASLYMALTLAGTLTIIAYFLRKKNIADIYIFIFVAMIVYYPPFAGNIFGQFYFDRFFIFHGIVLLFLMHMRFSDRKSLTDLFIIIAFLLSMLISERTAIMSAYIVVYFFIFNWRQISFKDDYKIMFLPVLAFIYIAIYMYAFQNSPYYSQISIGSIVSNLFDSLNVTTVIGQKTLVMFIVLLPFIFLSVFNIKYMFLTIFPIILNLIVTVGGAEKIGFTSHYHDMYIPFLLFSATMGLVNIYSMKHSKIIFSVFILLVLFSHNIKYENQQLTSGFLYSEIVPSSEKNQILQSDKMLFMKLVADIPHTAKVSSLESYWPVLVDHGVSRIDYFPIGLNDNEYLIVEYIGKENITNPVVQPYHPNKDAKEISLFIQKKISENFSIVKQVFYKGKNILIYKIKSPIKGSTND